MPTARNTLATLRVGFNWDQHKAAGLLGGDDYEGTVGEAFVSPCDGVVSFEDLGGVRVKHASGYSIVGLEGARRLVHEGQRVTAGVTALMIAGLVRETNGKTYPHWLHVHGVTPKGVRITFQLALARIEAYDRKIAAAKAKIAAKVSARRAIDNIYLELLGKHATELQKRRYTASMIKDRMRFTVALRRTIKRSAAYRRAHV